MKRNPLGQTISDEAFLGPGRRERRGLAVKVWLIPQARASDVLAVEAEGDMVWGDRPAKFLECLGIQSEQE